MIALEQIRAARDRIADLAVRTPLVRLYAESIPAGTEIYVKLETLQPINSFKIRGAGNAIRAAAPELRANGLLTASAGNMAQGVAWVARELGLPATIAVPEHAPQTKLDAIATSLLDDRRGHEGDAEGQLERSIGVHDQI